MKRLLLGSLLVTSLLYAEGKPYEFGVGLGMTSIDNEDGLNLEDATFGLSFQMNGYGIKPRFDLEYTSLDDSFLDKIKDGRKDVDSLLRLSANAVYEYDNNMYLFPYFLAGIGYERVGNGAKGFDSNPFFQAGIGAKYEVTPSFNLKLEAKALQIIGGDKEEDNEAIVMLGFGIPFGAYKQPTPPAPVFKDSDNDGVMDRFDKCPGTPEGVKVDGSGCPLPEAQVIEKIVNVPTNFDNNECPVKTDLPDLDRDGIEDSLDQCPATPCDFSVDSKGCPVKAVLRIHFETDKARITDFSRPKVEKFAQFLLDNKGSLVHISGHTDWRGSDEYNMLLSKRRAESVRNALIEYGVSESRLSSEGKGEREPMATNKTQEGMALNRRIEVKLTYPVMEAK